jgi:hypothetical protein
LLSSITSTLMGEFVGPESLTGHLLQGSLQGLLQGRILG